MAKRWKFLSRDRPDFGIISEYSDHADKFYQRTGTSRETFEELLTVSLDPRLRLSFFVYCERSRQLSDHNSRFKQSLRRNSVSDVGSCRKSAVSSDQGDDPPPTMGGCKTHLRSNQSKRKFEFYPSQLSLYSILSESEKLSE
jgi:hypothetical protein